VRPAPLIARGHRATGRDLAAGAGLERTTIDLAAKPWMLDVEARHAAPGRRQEVAMGIIAWIVVGAIAGFITNMIMGGKEGVIGTIILGIIGAVVGGYLAGTVLKVADVTGINIESIVVAVFGGIIVVAVYRLVTGRRAAI
jgi:uncharacterized membrane protein YeaQ/YmgE (transglycosylase-associated protein family)